MKDGFMNKHGGGYGSDVLDFSTNLNPIMEENRINRLIEKSGAQLLQYPESSGKILTDAIAKRYNIEPNELYVGNGAADCLYHLALVMRFKNILLIEPTFTEYRRAFQSGGTQVFSVVYPIEMNIQAKAEADLMNRIKEQWTSTPIESKIEMIVLCTPNNPTGHGYSDDFIKWLLAFSKEHGCYVLFDESFRFFESTVSYYEKGNEHILCLTSLTKYYGVPGLRIGYIAGALSVIERLKEAQPPWSVNGMVLPIMERLFLDDSFDLLTEQWYKKEKAYMTKELSELAYLKVLPSYANFICCRLNHRTGTDLYNRLMGSKYKIAIRCCNDFVGMGDSFIRIGLRNHSKNQRLIEVLKDCEV